MKKKSAKHLLNKYQIGNATDKERIIVEIWYNQLGKEIPYKESINLEEDLNLIWANIKGEMQVPEVHKRFYLKTFGIFLQLLSCALV